MKKGRIHKKSNRRNINKKNQQAIAALSAFTAAAGLFFLSVKINSTKNDTEKQNEPLTEDADFTIEEPKRLTNGE